MILSFLHFNLAGENSPTSTGIKFEMSKFINAYKSASSRLIKKEFPVIRNQLWKEYFWSQSFCLLTVGGAPLEVLKRYIQSQGV